MTEPITVNVNPSLKVDITVSPGRGIDGKDGRDGIDGRDGVDGRNGTDGINGTNGTNGTNGRDGIDGTGSSQDTGWRYLNNATFPNHANSDGIIRRIGNRVTCALNIKTIAYNTVILTIPNGFTGTDRFSISGQAKLVGIGTLINMTVHTATGATSPRFTWTGNSITFHGQNIGTNGTSTDLRMHAEWTTDNTWPATLPGTPA